MMEHDLGLESLAECREFAEKIEEPEINVNWELLSNSWLVDALIEEFQATTYPSLVVGPPWTGKSLGTV